MHFYTLVVERGDNHEDIGPWLDPDDAVKAMSEQATLVPLPTRMTLFETKAVAGWEPKKMIDNEPSVKPDIGGEG